MTAWVTRAAGATDEDTAVRLLRGLGLDPRLWGNGPGDRYPAHRHDYHKVLLCLAGGITFTVAGGDLALQPGDRLDIGPGTEHSAAVGPAGVRCAEGGGRPGQPLCSSR